MYGREMLKLIVCSICQTEKLLVRSSIHSCYSQLDEYEKICYKPWKQIQFGDRYSTTMLVRLSHDSARASNNFSFKCAFSSSDSLMYLCKHSIFW